MALTSALVGRERELALLADGLDSLATGRGALFVVTGEPGIGKTRLADELSARARERGVTVAWGTAWDGGGAPAFWPWIQVLRALRPDLPDPDARLRRDLGPLWDDDPASDERDAELVAFRRFEALRAVLAAAGARAPLLVVLDDLHAADRASLLALQLVARGLRGMRVLVVATHRDAEARLDSEVGTLLARAAREATTIHLPRLDRDGVTRLLGGLEPVGADLIDRVYEASSGNPLFAAETVRLVRTGTRGLPGSVEALLRERLARFEPEARAALEAAAVLGREVTWNVLSAAGVHDARARLRLPLLAGVVEEDGDDRVRFGHALFRQRLLDELAPRRRAALHLAAADALLRVGPAGEVADETMAGHLLAALPEGDPARAADWAIRAADRTFRALAFDRTVALAEGALGALAALPADPARRVDLELLLAHALVALGAGERARAICRGAAETARAIGDGVRLAHAALAYGAEIRVGVVDPVLVALLGEAAGTIDEPGLRARVLARQAAAEQPARDPRVPVERALAAVALARESGDADALAGTLHGAGAALGAHASPKIRRPLSRELAALGLARGDLILAQRGYARLAIDAADLADFDELDAATSAYERLGVALGHPRWRWAGPLLRAMRLLAEGRWDEAARAEEEATQLVAQAEDGTATMALALHRIGAVSSRRSMMDEAAIARLERLGAAAPPSLVFESLGRAMNCARLGRPDLAREALDRLPVPLASLAAHPGPLCYLADAVMRIGDREAAAIVLPALQALDFPALSWGLSGFIWEGPTTQWIGGLHAVLGQWGPAVVAWEDALATCERLAARPLAAQARAELAAALVGRGGGEDAARAAELLDVADADAAALDLPYLGRRIAEIRATFPAARRATPRDAGFALVREGDIWSITSNGRTLRLKHSRALEILDVLLMSPGREIHVLDLGAPDPGEGVIDVGDAGEALDPTAQKAYRRRMAELEEDLAEADAWNDAGRRERARAELEFLREELAYGVGIGGRDRRAASAVERARVNVQKRLRGVIKKIAEALPDLGAHLETHVKTGTYVSYQATTRP